METLIKDSITLLQAKKKRPAMEEIFNMVVRQSEGSTIEEFKDVFDCCLDSGTIKQRGEKDWSFVDVTESYEHIDDTEGTNNITSNNNNPDDDINPDVFSRECNNSNMGDKSRNGIEDRDLIDMIKANMYQEKVRIDQYIHDLKDDIKFLRNQALRKDEIILNYLPSWEINR